MQVWKPTKESRGLHPACFIDAMNKDFHENFNETLYLPKKDDGTEYSIDDLYDDQKIVVGLIIKKKSGWNAARRILLDSNPLE